MGARDPIGDAELAELQRAVLAAVLEGGPLPGREQPIAFPDLSLVAGGPAVLVADENLAGPLGDVVAGKRVRVRPSREIAAYAGASGDAPFFSFGPPESEGDEVVFRLDARLASATSGAPTLGLSGMVLRFRPGEHGWEAADEPAFYAA